MNNLSWFIYLADVIPGLGGLLVFVTIVCVFGFFLHMFLVWVSEDLVKPNYNVLAIIIAIALLSCLIPSKETLYLIAGSETAEAVATTEVGQEVLNDIHEVIKVQLNNMKEQD